MSKILKIVAVVAAVAAAIPTGGGSLLGLGIASGVFTAVSLAAGIGASLLAKRPRAPANSRESIDRLRASIDTRAARKLAVGVSAMTVDAR